MRRALLLLACLIAAHQARAEPVTLKLVAPPAVHHPPGRALDVAGIVPGMSPDEVRAVLAKTYGDVQAIQENVGFQDQGVDVASQNFVTRMAARRDNDEVTVWFGTPTTGNAVVEVTRQTNYGNAADAPELTAVRAQLVAKYGPPALDAPAVGTGELKILAWSYQGDKPVACPAMACRTDLTDGLNLADLTNYRRVVKRGFDLTVTGMMLAGIGDSSRAASVIVTVSDTATKLKTAESAMAQMRAAAHPAPAKPRR